LRTSLDFSQNPGYCFFKVRGFKVWSAAGPLSGPFAAITRQYQNAFSTGPLRQLNIRGPVPDADRSPPRNTQLLRRLFQQFRSRFPAGTFPSGRMRTPKEAVQTDTAAVEHRNESLIHLFGLRSRDEPAPHARLVRDHYDPQARGLKSPNTFHYAG